MLSLEVVSHSYMGISTAAVTSFKQSYFNMSNNTEVWLSIKWVFQGTCFYCIMTWCRCSSLILSALQSPAISFTVLQNSIKLLSVVLFVLEDTLGVKGKEPFYFPTTYQLSDASIIVLEMW